MGRFILGGGSGSDKPDRLVPMKNFEAKATATPPGVPSVGSVSSPTYAIDAAPSTSTKVNPEEPKPAYTIDETVFYAYIVPHKGSSLLEVIVLTHPDAGFIPRRVHASFTRPSYERVFESPPVDCKQDPRLEPYVSGKVKLPTGGRLRRYSPPFLDLEVARWKDSPHYGPSAHKS
ncbi:MAG: hypothetical protein AABX53_00165 [Nanoarchaeota archaeon]